MNKSNFDVIAKMVFASPASEFLVRLQRQLLVVVLALYAMVLIPVLVTHGMSLDGLIYATIARNLARGEGTFWFPSFSETFFSAFHEHPPLGLWVESIAFRLLGDGIYVEKLYSALLLVLVLVVMAVVWKQVHVTRFQSNHYWILVVMFIIIPRVHYTFRNNFLENLLTVITMSAVLTQLRALDVAERWSWIWAGITGGLVTIGMLIKGPVALFPLTTAGCYWIAFGFPHPKRFMIVGITPIVVATLSTTALFLMDDANRSLSTYFNVQLVSSISGQRTIHYGRVYILKWVLESLARPLVFLGTVVLTYRFFSGKAPNIDRINLKYCLFFLLVALCASLPLMISPRQYKHYIVPSLPLYVLSVASLATPLVDNVLKQWENSKTLKKLLHLLFAASIFVASILGVINFGHLKGSSKLYLPDTKEIARYVGEGKRVSFCASLASDYELIAYLARYYSISVVQLGKGGTRLETEYLLCKVDQVELPKDRLKAIATNLSNMELWQRF